MPTSASGAVGPRDPYVGLRSFGPSESQLFCGRKQPNNQVLRLLGKHRFVGVIGASGSGKSSLVKAALMPALTRGYLRASSRWKFAIMRPGDSPLSRLAEALCSEEGLNLAMSPQEVMHRLDKNSTALIRLIGEALNRSLDCDNVLLVIDQFEEIFRIRHDAKQESLRQTAHFVSLLLRAREAIDVPIFIAMTMCSEYLGDCAQYPGLTDVLNEAQYHIPRLTREQREQAIREPLVMVGTDVGIDIDDELVQRLLNDAGDGPDQLPALQHALMRLYEETPRGVRLCLDRYSENMRAGRSLNFQAQNIYESLSAPLQKLAERVFRCLTTTDKGREVRRPTTVAAICKIAGAAPEEVHAVMSAFAKKKPPLLFFSTGNDLTDDTMVDITSESLIRQWKLLKEWVHREAESADRFARLVQAAELHSDDQSNSSLWGNPEVEYVFRRSLEECWTSHWGDQYHQGFAEAMAFLKRRRDSIAAAEQEKRQRAEELEQARQRELERTHKLLMAEQEKRQRAEELEQARQRELERTQKLLIIALIGLASTIIGLLYFIWFRR